MSVERCQGGCGGPALLAGMCVGYWRRAVKDRMGMAPIVDGRCLACGSPADDHGPGQRMDRAALMGERQASAYRAEGLASFCRPYPRCGGRGP